MAGKFGAKAMVCAAAEIVNDRATSGAAAYWVSPAWLATRVQVPLRTIVTFMPDTVHTSVVDDATVASSPESVDALTLNGVADHARAPGLTKVIVWSAPEISNEWVTAVAAA